MNLASFPWYYQILITVGGMALTCVVSLAGIYILATVIKVNSSEHAIDDLYDRVRALEVRKKRKG